MIDGFCCTKCGEYYSDLVINIGNVEIIRSLEKMNCLCSDKHKMRVIKFNEKTGAFTVRCSDCEKDGITHDLKGTIKKKA